jgi:aspartate aminotransferase
VLALAARLRAQGRDIISLGAGEPDFDTPQYIKDAAVLAIADGQTKYTPIDGTAELKAAIQRKFGRDNQLTYDVSQIIVTSGGKQALFNLCIALLGPGDEVIIPAPYWVSYPDMVLLAEAEPVIVDTGIEHDFKMTPDQLEAALTENSRLVILNSPSNPTGASYTRSELQNLGAVLEPYPNVVVVADDMYEHIYWANEPFVSFATACPALFDRTVTTNGVSKAYAMTGWRIGFAGGPQRLIAAMATVQSQSTSNPCSVSQAAALAALDGDQAMVLDMCTAYKKRHDYMVTTLNAIDGFECRPGEGTFYAFPRISGALERLGLENDVAFTELLINEADVACVPGSAFGAPGYLRISFATAQAQLEEAMKRIGRVLNS